MEQNSNPLDRISLEEIADNIVRQAYQHRHQDLLVQVPLVSIYMLHAKLEQIGYYSEPTTTCACGGRCGCHQSSPDDIDPADEPVPVSFAAEKDEEA